MKKLSLTLILLNIFFISYSQEFTLIHDGITRTYRLHMPTGYDPDSLHPLVINMHGLGSNALEQEFYSEFDPVADSNGVVVAYPNGLDETWNVSSTTGTDDVGFISALIDTVSYLYNIDPDRVYATGMSMGGFMSYRLACELSDRIAAIASVAGLQAFYPCNPDRPVPVAQFHGTADEVVPYVGVATTINNWVNYNGCPAEPIVTELPDIDTTDNSTVTTSYYGPCELSTEVLLYTIINGGHTWPGASYIIGTTNNDIEASREIWNFFNKFTLQGSTQVQNLEPQQIHWNFYPNPVKDFATVELQNLPEMSFTFILFDMTGKTLLSMTGVSSRRFGINCTGIPAGIYLSELKGERSVAFQKVIVR